MAVVEWHGFWNTLAQTSSGPSVCGLQCEGRSVGRAEMTRLPRGLPETWRFCEECSTDVLGTRNLEEGVCNPKVSMGAL